MDHGNVIFPVGEEFDRADPSIVFLSFYKKAQRKAKDARHGKLSPYRSNPLSWIPDTGMSHRVWVNRERSGQTENLLGIWKKIVRAPRPIAGK